MQLIHNLDYEGVFFLFAKRTMDFKRVFDMTLKLALKNVIITKGEKLIVALYGMLPCLG
jgi:hypothetical protein